MNAKCEFEGNKDVEKRILLVDENEAVLLWLSKTSVRIITPSKGVDLGTTYLHCEIKLYLYLRKEGITMKQVRLSISKPLCGDCLLYFMNCVANEDRPKLLAGCSTQYKSSYLTKNLSSKVEVEALWSRRVIKHPKLRPHY